MNKFKKAMVACLVGAVSLTSLVGCNGGGGTSNSGSGDTAGSTIKVQRWGTADEQVLYEALSDKFTEETGVKVKWDWQDYSNYFTNLQLTIASNTNDVIFINSSN